MPTGQAGIFALGDAAHGFFEFTLRDGIAPRALVDAIAALRPPRTTVGGVNLVVGFGPDLWRAAGCVEQTPALHGFDAPVTGSDGYTMPATQADAFIWYAAAAYDIVFDLGVATVSALAPVATLTRELTGWSYRHSRDLTGFEDGTENPTIYEAPSVALITDGAGAGGSVLLFQQWRHLSSWGALPVAEQERVIGRTKPDSIEFDDETMPPNSHVARTKVHQGDEELPIFRRNVPYGDVTDHGTLFIGFSGDQQRLQMMLEQMAGIGGPRDALTNFSTPLTGAYYYCPSVDELRELAPEPED
jgi:putative iron-dependent peroxidase